MLFGIIAVISGVAFWWWRVKAVGEVASEATDAAGRLLGQYRRHKFRKKVEDAPLETVDDPAVAAVVMMFVVARDAGPLLPQAEAMIRSEIQTTMQIPDPEEIFIFSRWVASHAIDANNISLRYGKLWMAKLNLQERRDLLAMVGRVAETSGMATAVQKTVLGKLSERLGLLA